jgi:hypothetical protein
LTEPDRIDFKIIIADLQRAGVSLYKIALMCRRQFNTVKHWKATGRLEWYDGEKLRILHEHYCKELTTSITQ